MRFISKLPIDFRSVISIAVLILCMAAAASAATFTVNTTLDSVDASPGNGICADAAGNCSLRAAIGETNQLAANPATRVNTIILPAGVYTLTITGTPETNNASGDLNIRNSSNLTITGDSPRTTIIQAGTVKSTNGTDGNGIDRVLSTFNSGAVILTLNNLTIRHGKRNTTGSSNDGGGIQYRRAISTTGGALSINNCNIVDNFSLGNGGGITSDVNLSITNSLIANNRAFTSTAYGGGLFAGNSENAGSTINLTNSTFSGNTISNASAGGQGGGIFIGPFNNGLPAFANITNCTVSGNSGGRAGGVGALTSNTEVRLRNTIAAGNTATVYGPDVASVSTPLTIVSGGSNLIGNASTSGGWGASDLLNNSSANLGPLANNGGPTDTHALQYGSAAIDAGQNCVVDSTCATFNAPANLENDQRGLERNVNGIGLSSVDIGAYEYRPPDINSSPASHAFGDVLVGTSVSQQVTVSNSGDVDLVYSASLSGTDADQFSLNGFTPTPLAPGASVEITVTFAPGSVGAKSADLVLSSNDPDEVVVNIPFTGTGFVPPPEIDVTPLTINYPSVTVGSSSPASVTISNSGGSDLTYSIALSGPNAGEFSTGSFTPVSIPVGGSAIVPVVFSPTSAGPKSAALVISSNDPDEASVSVTLNANGTLPPPVIGVPAGQISFGNVTVGTSASQQFTVSNSGGSNLEFAIGLSSPDFAFVAPPTTTLAPGQSTNVTVNFAPTGAGEKTATLTVSSNDPATPTANVGLIGTGQLPPPVMDVSPTDVAFGNVLIGSSASQVFTISNDGGSDLTYSISLGSSDFAFTAPGTNTIPAGQTAEITVIFTPTGAGPRTATLQVTGNDPANPSASVNLSGTGVVQPPTTVNIAGRVSNARNRGIKGVTITIVSTSTTFRRQVVTDRQGNYVLTNVPVGDTYTITPSKKRTTFTPASRTLLVAAPLSGVNFTTN